MFERALHGESADLRELTNAVPGLGTLIEPFSGSAAISTSREALRRFCRHLTRHRRLDAADLSLFDAFPSEERRAMLHAIGNELARRQERRARAVDRLALYRRHVIQTRDRLLTPKDRQRIQEAAASAVQRLGEDEACWLVEDAFYLPTLTAVHTFCHHKEAIFESFERRVRVRAAELLQPAESRTLAARLRALATLGLQAGA